MNRDYKSSNFKLHRLPEVKDLTGLSRSTIYYRMRNGTFPKSISLGPRTIGWLHEDIQKWIADRVQGKRLNENGAEK